MENELELLQSINEVGYVLSVSDSKIVFDVDKNLSLFNLLCPFISFNFYYLNGVVGSEHYRNIFVKTRKGMPRIAECVSLQESNILKEQLADKIKLQIPSKKQEITDLLTLDKDLVLVKGTFNYFSTNDDCRDGFPYFGILFRSDDTLIIEGFRELLHVLLIDEKYYFVTYWQEPECGKRGLIIYTVEEKGLKEVCADYSEAT